MKANTRQIQEAAGELDPSDKSKDEHFTDSSLLSKRQVAAALNVTVRTISKWQKRGDLPFIKIGGRCLYPWGAVQDKLRREFGRNWN